MRDAMIAGEAGRSGKPFAEYTAQDYAAFMQGLQLDEDEDRWLWSHVTGIPVIVVRNRQEFFRYNAHLLDEPVVARSMSAAELPSPTTSTLCPR